MHAQVRGWLDDDWRRVWMSQQRTEFCYSCILAGCSCSGAKAYGGSDDRAKEC